MRRTAAPPAMAGPRSTRPQGNQLRTIQGSCDGGRETRRMAPPALWLTLPGASPVVGVAWVVWVTGAAVAASLLVALLGPAGAVLAVLVPGWLVARRLPPPTECLRRYHLDDAEVTAFGPGR